MIHKQVLLYHYTLQNERAKIVREIFNEKEIEIVDVQYNMLGLTLKQSLNKVSVTESYNEKDFDQEFMVFSGIEDEEIQAVINLISERNVKNLGPVAVVTKHNLEWPLEKLFADLSEEHHFFIEIEKLQNLIKQADLKKKDEYEEVGWKKYEEALMIGYMLMQEESMPLESVKKTIVGIEESYENLIKKG